MSKPSDVEKAGKKAGLQLAGDIPALRALQKQADFHRASATAKESAAPRNSHRAESESLDLVRSEKGIIDAATLISMDKAKDQDTAFLGRQLVQATLPHSDPGNVPTWTRTNGNVTLIIQQGVTSDGLPIGYPYGSIPRLLMYWITTEAVRTKRARLMLGSSMAGFMEEIGLDHRRGGERSDRYRLVSQAGKLFAANISFHGDLSKNGVDGAVTRYFRVASATALWWNRGDIDSGLLAESFIELDPKFLASITASPVPVDLRALRAIKSSPLALDLYALMTYEAFRAQNIDKPRFLSWSQLQAALGTDYRHVRNFRKAVQIALKKIESVYQGLALSSRDGGIEVLPESTPAISRRS